MIRAVAGTVTFLFSDVEGSTRLLRQLGTSYGRALGDHHRLLRAAFERHGGEEVDTQGDSFFVAFGRPGDALLAAVEAQRALAAHEWPDGVAVRVRMGLHTGPAAAEDGRYVGLAVHRAARICAAGHGGQILLSQTTVDLLEDDVDLPGIDLRELGAWQLKDFDRPVGLYQAEAEGLRHAFPPPRTDEKPGPDDGSRQGPIGLLRTWRGAAPLAAALLLLAAATAFVLLRDDEKVPPITPKSLVRIDPQTNEVVDVIDVPAVAEQVVATPRYVWFLSGVEQNRTLFRMEIATEQITPFGGFDAPCALATDQSGRVWIASCDPGGSSVVRVYADGRAGRRFAVQGQIGALAADRDAIYVTVLAPSPGEGGEVAWRLPLRGGKRQQYEVGAAPFSLDVTEDAIWVANYESDSLTEISLVTGSQKTIPTSAGPSSVAADERGVWVSHFSDPVVWKFNPGSDQQVGTRTFPNPVAGIALTATGVWIASPADSLVYRLDPKSTDILARIPFGPGNAPAGIAATPEAVWVTVTPPPPAG